MQKIRKEALTVTKYQLITGLYGYTAGKVTSTPAEWTAFLRSACRNYKCRFDEQILIYAQRPDATAVLELEKWNSRYGRWVNHDAKGIAVFDDDHNGTLADALIASSINAVEVNIADYIKSYCAVCLEGAIIVLACVIFSVFASSPPVVDTSAAAVTQVWGYVGELIFNMLVLVGAVKMADRVVREMMGL